MRFSYISDATGMVVLTEYDKVRSRRTDIRDSGEEEEEQKGWVRQGKETWLFIGRIYKIGKKKFIPIHHIIGGGV